MSERHPTTGPAGPAPRPAAPPPPADWEHLFPTLPPDAQQTLLRRAAARGGLTARDLPPPAAGRPDPASRFLAADPKALPAFDPVAPAAGCRPPAAYAAVSHALGCPDLFLVDATGPDQLAYAADLAAEAARAGERVLVVTPGPADADAVLARLAAAPDLLAGRALAPYEEPARLPAASACRTARVLGDEVLSDARDKVRARVAAAEARRAAVRAAAAAVASLHETAGRLAALDADAARARAGRDGLPAVVAAEAEAAAGDGPFAVALRGAADAHAAEVARIDGEARKAAAELAGKREELAGLNGSVAELGAKAEAKKAAGVLAGFFKGLFAREDCAAKAAVLAPAIQAAEAAVRAIEAAAARLADERAAADAAYRAARDAAAADETARRAAGIEQRLADLAGDRDRLAAEFRRLAAAFRPAGLAPPDAPTAEAVGRAAGPLAALAERADAELGAARGWAGDLAAHGGELVRRFLAQVRVVVGPLAAAGADPLAPAPGGEPAFDRLILTDADFLPAAEFPPAARYAGRWVLVGDATDPAPAPRGRGAGKPARSGPPAFFRRLWLHLDREPWATENGKLVARLSHAADPDSLVREPLADRPEVEVRFAPGGEPVLAEVAFPPGTPAAAAKTFLAQELNEIRVVPCGPAVWHETADRVTACWPAVEESARHVDWADLAPGVREKVVGTGPDCRTAAVAFEAAAGWDRDRAAAWLAGYAAAPRTAHLPRPVVVLGPPPARRVAGVAG